MKAHILEKFIQRVWNEGNAESAPDFIAPAYTIHHDPGDPWEGMTLDPEGFKDRVRKSRAPVPDQRFELQDVLEGDDRVVVTWLWKGTHLGDIAGFPPSGQELSMSGATVYYFDGEHITGHWQIADRLSIYRQLQQASTR
ncbi:MAG: ester cyclase [Gammaproteobacteria bacterium]